MHEMALPFPTLGRINWNLGYRGGIFALCLVLLLSLAACSTTWLVDLETYLPVGIAAATGLVTILVSSGALGPALPAEIAAVSSAVTEGLNLLCGTPVNNQCNPTSLVGTFSANPTATLQQRIQEVLNSVQTNLQQWLALIHIKNTTLQATITAGISLLITTFSAIISRITPVAAAMMASGPKAAKKAMAQVPKMPLSAGQFKAQFNRIVTDGGYPQVAVR